MGVYLREGDLLATAHVTSLYTNISHRDGMEAVSYFLVMADYIPPPQKDFILKLLDFAMSFNYFCFTKQFFFYNSKV